jgi:hypothetical protein
MHAAFEGKFLRAATLKEGVEDFGVVNPADLESSLLNNVDDNHGRVALVKQDSFMSAYGVPRYGCGFLSRGRLEEQWLAAYSRPHEKVDWTLAGIEKAYVNEGAQRDPRTGRFPEISVYAVLDAIIDPQAGLPELRAKLVEEADGSDNREDLFQSLWRRMITLNKNAKSSRKAECGFKIHGAIKGLRIHQSRVSLTQIVPRGPVGGGGHGAAGRGGVRGRGGGRGGGRG